MIHIKYHNFLFLPNIEETINQTTLQEIILPQSLLQRTIVCTIQPLQYFKTVTFNDVANDNVQLSLTVPGDILTGDVTKFGDNFIEKSA